ncbi:MAG: crossover junction endodeoxyribonuclease RuvC, partial [Candidatus Omnitrophica bacterium]|nr:crossover junction endodeoxyribonuclease RuvC [Candidatus Omnitrophota bacterium]
TTLFRSKPDVIVLEKIYAHYKHPITAILMGHARGITCLLAGIKQIPLVNYPASRIKKAVTGNGSASKRQVQTLVTDILKLKKAPEPVDVSDALAIAISYVYMEMMGR